MRRLNFANRSTLFTPAVYANVTAKREMGVPSAKEFNFLLRLVLFSGFTATAGLIFGSYKIGRYVEQSSKKYKSTVDENGVIHFPKLEMPEVPFGPKTEQEAQPIKIDLTGFTIDSAGYWSRLGGLERSEEENSPKP